MVESVALHLLVASHVPVLLATPVLVALMTQMNVLPHPPYAKMREHVTTPQVPTSKNGHCLNIIRKMAFVFIMCLELLHLMSVLRAM